MKNKKAYNAPEIEQIVLDNEISLILVSDAPVGPDEVNNSGNEIKEPFYLG